MYRKITAPSSRPIQTRFTARYRQRAFPVALFLFLAACGAPKPEVGLVGNVKGFFGAAIVEEPRAALVARDVLSSGGTAADAATAAFFTMSVTYPVAVGLGGGGVCLYFDQAANKTETLDFRVGPVAAGGPVGIPGAVRGMALLHSRYGRLPWSQLVAPAETMARFGHQISRALAQRLASQAARLRGDAMAARIFLHTDGSPLGEADKIVQVELAAALTRVRTRGVSDIYGGEAGQQLVRAGNAAGGKVTIDHLRRYRANWRGTRATVLGNHMLHHPDLDPHPDRVPGENAAQQLTRLMAGMSAGKAADKVFSQEDLDRTDDRGEGAFVIGDSFGSAAACVFSMNGAFGRGVMAPGLGIFMASAANQDGAAAGGGGANPLPLLGVNDPVGQAVMAAVGAGGPNGALAAAAVALGVMDKDQTLDQAMTARATIKGGRVQALWCAEGIRTTPESCQFATDPKGHGLASFDKF